MFINVLTPYKHRGSQYNIFNFRKDNSGNPASSDPSQFLRLFLVVPKSYNEDDLRQHFSEFGAIDNVSIVKDRESKESKGYGYVKYKR